MTTKERTGAYLPVARVCCPTGIHLGALVAHITPSYIKLDNPPRYVCGCVDPREVKRR